MALTSYKEVRPYAKAIRDVVSDGKMPPWHADPHYGKFANDRRLSEAEVRTLLQWVNGGSPEGDPKDLPPAPKFTEGWQVYREHARTPVAGMAVLYERLVRAHPGLPVIYLSTGAWNVVPTLSRFLSRNLYPRGTLLLTDWGPTHDRWFRSGAEHKRINLERLAAEFPRVRWLLVGDDGQHDPQLYGDFAEAHPQNVAAVAIRQLTTGQAVLAGGRSEPEPHAAQTPWRYAPDGAGLSVQLTELGLLPALS